MGTTSACAENTTPDPLNAKTHGNYLRVRGEYRTCGACERFCGELPPRARRIHERDGWAHVLRGTTSACAENTWRAAQRDHDAGNYLRVRGEYRLKAGVIEKIMELPPRARRIRNDWCCHGSCGGTTSACAENTAVGRGRRLRKWNYLRVRGEYMLSWSKSCGSGELPPRARRILGLGLTRGAGCGTTSACAENTAAGHNTDRCAWNYLRVRGEYTPSRKYSPLSSELPPRARRIPSCRSSRTSI